jgi:hypothetical protein
MGSPGRYDLQRPDGTARIGVKAFMENGTERWPSGLRQRTSVRTRDGTQLRSYVIRGRNRIGEVRILPLSATRPLAPHGCAPGGRPSAPTLGSRSQSSARRRQNTWPVPPVAIGAVSGHHEHRSPRTRVATDARGRRSPQITAAHPDLAKCSRALRIAGLSGFLTLSQSRDGPDWQRRPRRTNISCTQPGLNGVLAAQADFSPRA